MTPQYPLEAEIDADGHTRAVRIPAVVQVVAVVVIVHVAVIRVVPVVAPVFRIRVHKREPVVVIVEAGSAVDEHEAEFVGPEPVASPEMAAEVGVRNAVPPVAAAL